jgi:hypothetical protein
MGRAKGVAKLAFGLLLTVLTLWNIYLGFFEVNSTNSMKKLVLTMLFSGECSESSVLDDINSTGSSDCLQPLGTWDPIDIMLLGMGLMVTWRALRELFSRKGRESGNKKSRRMIRIGILVGVVGIADFFGLLSNDGKPLDASDLLGFALPGPGLSLFLLTIALAFILAGNSMKRKGSEMMIGKDGSTAGSRQFLGSAERHLGHNFSVGDLRRALMLDAFEDPFQVSTGDGYDDMTAGRSCHYCSGSGCGQCGNTGEL